VDPRGRTFLDAVLSATGEEKRESVMSRLSRRQFVQIAGAGLTASNLGLAAQRGLTAGEVVDRIKKNLGIPWNMSTYRDTFKIGGPNSPVTGIATSFGANLRVLQLASKAGMNMVIVHEPTFYSDGDRIDLVKDDPLYRMKLDWANRNHIVVWRIHDHWHAHKPDGIATGWSRGMGWDTYQVNGSLRDFRIPETTLGELAKELARKLESRSVRVVGDASTKVSLVSRGGHNLAQNMTAMPNADCIIVSEAREYDSFEYARDLVLTGAHKGAIFISHTSGEDLGMEEFARFLKPIVTEVPIKFIPTTDEFWTV
jgi:putative NIF3 family GTP cyclohydrolase 1 type 2